MLFGKRVLHLTYQSQLKLSIMKTTTTRLEKINRLISIILTSENRSTAMAARWAKLQNERSRIKNQ